MGKVKSEAVREEIRRFVVVVAVVLFSKESVSWYVLFQNPNRNWFLKKTWSFVRTRRVPSRTNKSVTCCVLIKNPNRNRFFWRTWRIAWNSAVLDSQPCPEFAERAASWQGGRVAAQDRSAFECPGLHSVRPYLIVGDADEAITFYRGSGSERLNLNGT